jgi:hypothetical protein
MQDEIKALRKRLDQARTVTGAIDTLRKLLVGMTPSARQDVFQKLMWDYCPYCGAHDPNRRCACGPPPRKSVWLEDEPTDS